MMSADPEGCEDGPVTPVEFLTARLDELEAIAQAAYREPAEPGSPDYEAYGPDAGWYELDDLTSEERLWADAAALVVTMSPRLVLADIAAKRAIIAELGPPHWITGGSSAAFHAVVAHFAATFANHPDYRREWAPAQ